MTHRIIGLLGLVPALLGCGETGPDAASFHASDSAGITIAHSRAPSGPHLAIDSIPRFEIGPEAGSNGEFVSPVIAARLPDGRIAVNGWAMTEFRLYDSSGRWVRTVGRAGAGPGEFEALGFVFADDDGSLVTFEPGTQRLQRWDPDGTFRSLSAFVSPAGQPTGRVIGTLPNQDLLVQVTVDTTPPEGILLKPKSTVFAARNRTPAWDSLFSFDGRPQIRHPRYPRAGYGSPLFSPSPVTASRGGQIAFSSGDRFEIEIRDTDGQVRTSIRRDADTRHVSADELRKAIDGWIADAHASIRDEIAPRMRQASTARIRPAISGIWLTAGNDVWATWGDASLDEPNTASVFDTTGRWLTDVTIPPGVRILQVDQDGLLGTVVDDDGFHRIRFYGIRQIRP